LLGESRPPPRVKTSRYVRRPGTPGKKPVVKPAKRGEDLPGFDTCRSQPRATGVKTSIPLSPLPGLSSSPSTTGGCVPLRGTCPRLLAFGPPGLDLDTRACLHPDLVLDLDLDLVLDLDQNLALRAWTSIRARVSIPTWSWTWSWTSSWTWTRTSPSGLDLNYFAAAREADVLWLSRPVRTGRHNY